MMLAFALTPPVECFLPSLGFYYSARLVSFGEISISAYLVAFIDICFSGQAIAQMFRTSSSTKAR